MNLGPIRPLEYMTDRDDGYPGLEQPATIASQLGYAEGRHLRGWDVR